MKKILVPTDFSECANQAAQVALDLAKRLDAWVYFLHISPEASVKSIVHSEVELETHHQEVSSAKSQLDEWVRIGEDKGVTCFPVLVFDNGFEKIENYVKPYAIDLIVMGSHGATGIRKLILGSNADRVIKHVEIPTLIVKRIKESFSVNSFLFASSFQQNVSDVFSWIANVANGLNVEMHLLYLANVSQPKPENEALQEMKNLASSYPGLKCSLDYAITNDEEWAIRQVAEKLQASVIAVPGNEKEGGLVAANLASRLLSSEDRPILVLNKK